MAKSQPGCLARLPFRLRASQTIFMSSRDALGLGFRQYKNGRSLLVREIAPTSVALLGPTIVGPNGELFGGVISPANSE